MHEVGESNVTVIRVTQPAPLESTRSRRRKYRDKISLFGCLETFFGLALSVMSPYSLGQEMGIPFYKRDTYFIFNKILQGLWVGVFLMALGIVGLCTLRHPSYSMYVANLVLSIIVIVLSIAGLIIAFCGAALSWNIAIILHVLITIGLFIGLCLSIAHLRYTYKGIRRTEVILQHTPGMYLNTNVPISTDSVGRLPLNLRETQSRSSVGITTIHAGGSNGKDHDDDPPPPYPYQQHT